jgi:hypothetical protein
LAQNLRLAHHHGIQAGRHPEQVPHRLVVLIAVEVRFQHRSVQAEALGEEARQFRLQAVVGHQQLHAVAGGKDHGLGHARLGQQRQRGLRQLRRPDRQPLAQLDGRRSVVEACDQKSHFKPNL